MILGKVKQLNRYPIKSMAGETLSEIDLTTNGFRGDRAWAVRDEVRGGIRGAKQIPALMKIKARYEQAPELPSSEAVIVFPDGSSATTSTPNINQLLSESVGHSVSLWPLMPKDALDHYRRGAPLNDDLEKEMRSIFARTDDEPLPDISGFPEEVFEYESPPGTYFDVFPLLLLTEKSLHTLQTRWPKSRFDVKRFRPNILIAAPDNKKHRSTMPFPELAWLGKKIQIGECVINVTINCPRCIMTTHPFESLAKDPKIMRALVKENAGNLGVYASIEQCGKISVSDNVTLVE